MYPYQKIVFLFILLFLYATATCQTAGDFILKSQNIHTPFTVIQYSNKTGLPQNQVKAITSKSDESLLILTNNGAVSFNGFNFTSFISDNAYLREDFDQLIWVEEFQTLLAKSKNGILYTLYPQVSPLRFLIRKGEIIMTCHLSGNLLFIMYSSGYVLCADIKKRNIKDHFYTPVRGAICALYKPPYIFAGTSSGIHRLDVKNHTEEKIAETHFCSQIRINPYDSMVYAVTTRKILSVQSAGTTDILDLGPLDEKAFTDIAFGPDKHMYISSSEGLFILLPGKPAVLYGEEQGLPADFISCLLYNYTENCLFAGTLVKGLLKLQFKTNLTYFTEAGMDETSLRSVVQTGDGKIITAEICCKIFELDKDTAVLYYPSNTHMASINEIDGLLFIGTWGNGLNVIKDHELVYKISPPFIPPGEISAIFKDKKGNFWIGTNKGMAKGYGYKQMAPLLTDKIRGHVGGFYELRNGLMVVFGGDGFYIIKDDRLVKEINEKDGLLGKEVRAVYEGKNGILWIGTYGGGLFAYKNDTLTSINARKGCMLDKDVFCLVPDRDGYIYITSNHGLWRIKENDMISFYEGRLTYLIPFRYGEENGILNPEFNGGFYPNYLKTATNEIYFPTIEGLVKTLPEKLSFRKIVPTINNIYVNDTLISSGKHIFPRNTYSMHFDYSCVNYARKYNVYFQHKLSGTISSDWSAPTKDRNVDLKVLPPGKYKFSVRAIDGFNDPHPKIAFFEFEIKPYFYETFAFKLVMLIVMALLIILGTSLRVRHLRKKEKAREKIKRQLAEFELKSIQAQMNPHFIFNCLNSIKFFVITEQKQNASKFLDHFSILIRKFLENSDLIEVPLHEEIKMLTDYLELEKMRMNGQFVFSVEANEEIIDMLIPTMLTQPFVENAVKNAFADINIKGKIDIRYYLVPGYLVCEIEDNGIGRVKGLEISEQMRKHVSKGIVLVKEKNELLQQLYDKNIIIQITDKYTPQGVASGTLVTVKVPI